MLIGVPRTRTVAKPRAADTKDRAQAGEGREIADADSTVLESDEQVPADETSDRVDEIKNVIPIEVVTGWIVIHSFPEVSATNDGPSGFYWAVFGLVFVGTGLHMWIDIELPDPEAAARMNLTPGKLRIAMVGQIALAMGAFLVWGLYLAPPVDVPLGGTTVALDKPRATAMLVLYTLLGPQLVPGLLSKVVGVDLDPGDGTIDVDHDDETPT